jgi:hypothetical protein
LTRPPAQSKYGDLVQGIDRPEPRSLPGPEEELDALIAVKKESDGKSHVGRSSPPDPIQALREQTINELVPVFVELVEKYSRSGISLQMDASNFLEGGREIKFEFGIGEYRAQLQGTVTTEGIAFHETRHSPEVYGELISGPMLRLRTLTRDTFREFVCERLTLLLRAAMRGH